MGYEEKYKNALENLKLKMKDFKEIIISREDVEEIFPELAKPEDEKIRKALVDFFNRGAENGEQTNGVCDKDILAWLEKQKSVGEIVERCKDSWYNEGKIQGQIEGLTDDEKYQQGWHDALERQVPVDKEWDEKIRRHLIKHFSNKTKSDWNGVPVHSILAWLEKQGKEEYALKSFKDEDVRKFMEYIEKQAKAYEFNLPNRSYDIYAFSKDILSWLEKQCEKQQYKTELKMSEDMQIMKEISEFIYNSAFKPKDLKKKEKWLTWFNKQGEKPQGKSALELWKDMRFEVGAQASGNRHEPPMSDNDTKLFSLNDIDEIMEKITEKQSSKTYCGKSALEAAKEEKVDNQNCVKPAHKVEPKFKVGDWITNGDYTWKIVEVKPLDYILQSQDGNIVDDTISYVDEQFHSFTIEDAKDGDVLVSQYGKPFIYNGNRDSLHIGSYCGISVTDTFHVSTEKCHWTANVSIYPAAQEQRDNLFAKMKEAGYTFDFEKKELNKIEYEIEIPFGAKDSELHEVAYFIPQGFHAEIEGDKVVIKKGEKPIAWSEEDERAIGIIRIALEHPYDMEGKWDRNFALDWLKSLKQRIEEQQ